jgi:hypothetical protein
MAKRTQKLFRWGITRIPAALIGYVEAADQDPPEKTAQTT